MQAKDILQTNSPQGESAQPKTPPQPKTLSLPELCQQFIDHHCAGQTELARPFLAELIRRNEYQRALQAIVQGVSR